MPPKHHTSNSYLSLDRKSGSGRIGKPVYEKSAPKVRAGYHRSCAWRQKEHQPLDQLPLQYLVYPGKSHSDVPRFHFGLGVTHQQLHEYAVRHGLVSPEFYSNRRLDLETIEATVKHLDRLSGVNLYLEPALHPKYSWVVARYSNHTWYHEEVHQQEENRVIDLIRRELNVENVPQWHHNISP